MVCYDGPGFKSPLLQFTFNQSVWECLSSTFQMACKFLRGDHDCTNGPRLYYRAIRARDHQVRNLHVIELCPPYTDPLIIDEAHSQGTTKYVYYHPDTASISKCVLTTKKIHVSFPYMLSEGNPCMYGGIYLVHTISSKDSEILSFCAPINPTGSFIYDLKNISVMVIHYSEYSTERLIFFAYYDAMPVVLEVKELNQLDLHQNYTENTLCITVPKLTISTTYLIRSFLLKLRKNNVST